MNKITIHCDLLHPLLLLSTLLEKPAILTLQPPPPTHTHIHTHRYTQTHRYTHKHDCTKPHTHRHTQTNTSMNAQTYTHAHKQTHTHKHMQTWKNTCTHVTCKPTHVQTHTHTQTHIQAEECSWSFWALRKACGCVCVCVGVCMYLWVCVHGTDFVHVWKRENDIRRGRETERQREREGERQIGFIHLWWLVDSFISHKWNSKGAWDRSTRNYWRHTHAFNSTNRNAPSKPSHGWSSNIRLYVCPFIATDKWTEPTAVGYWERAWRPTHGP